MSHKLILPYEKLSINCKAAETITEHGEWVWLIMTNY